MTGQCSFTINLKNISNPGRFAIGVVDIKNMKGSFNFYPMILYHGYFFKNKLDIFKNGETLTIKVDMDQGYI